MLFIPLGLRLTPAPSLKPLPTQAEPPLKEGAALRQGRATAWPMETDAGGLQGD